MYQIQFEPTALKSWNDLEKSSRERFKKLLAKRLHNPRVASARVTGQFADIYRLKLSSDGLRLIYKVNDHENAIHVLVVGKREDLEAYRKLKKLFE